MRTHALHNADALRQRPAAAARAPRRRSARLVQFALDRFLLIPLGAVIALTWANTAADSYFRFAQAIAFPVNEIAMAFFLGLLAQEAFEATMPGGELHTWRRWTLPVIAAGGGVAGAALTYLGYIYFRHEQVLWQAWPVAIAIDIVAAYYLMKLIQPRGSALPFVLVLAIATNVFGLALIAGWPAPTPGHVTGAVFVLAGIGVAAYLRRTGVRQFWPYFVLAGPCSWLGFYLAGVHPALSLLPIIPFLPHEPRSKVFAEPPADDAVHRAELHWREAVQVIVFLFALVNAGVTLTGHDTGTWGVLAAAFVGRPLGILLAVGVAVTLGLHLPPRLKWRQLIVLALVTSSGFTFALFFASSLLPVGGVLQQIKFGALVTVAGAPMALLAARLLRVGRFAAPVRPTGGTHGVPTQAR
jgi:NhaA family Na+:H+ antiporter